jgi:hypothetical protein
MNILTIILISIVSGFFSGISVWADNISDVRFSINDMFMIVLTTAWMLFFESIITFRSAKDSKILQCISIILIFVCIYFIRTQLYVDDMQYLKSMIPHHSMAILMSERIKEKTINPNISQLADNIINSQKKEIKLMKQLKKLNI